jgi:DNA-binding response OmpR family regulator
MNDTLHSATILIIEDDASLTACMSDALRQRSFSVQSVSDGYVAKSIVMKQTVDLVILDLTLPGADGREVLDSIRSHNPFLPVLLISGRLAIDERVGCLEQGADDFLPKPFSLAELVARVSSLLRRSNQQQTVRFGEIRLDRMSRRVSSNGQSVDLTHREYLLLQFLIENAGHIVTRAELLKSVWGLGFDPKTNIVDVYMTYLRKKLDPSDASRYIRTHRGKGYEFVTKADRVFGAAG